MGDGLVDQTIPNVTSCRIRREENRAHEREADGSTAAVILGEEARKLNKHFTGYLATFQ
jgi:hypothetical protein